MSLNSLKFTSENLYNAAGRGERERKRKKERERGRKYNDETQYYNIINLAISEECVSMCLCGV